MTKLMHSIHDSFCHVADRAIYAMTGEVIGQSYDVYPDDLSDLIGGHLS